jgi:hypothetical protein
VSENSAEGDICVQKERSDRRWRTQHNEQFYNLYSSANIIREIKSRKT